LPLGRDTGAADRTLSPGYRRGLSYLMGGYDPDKARATCHSAAPDGDDCGYTQLADSFEEEYANRKCRTHPRTAHRVFLCRRLGCPGQDGLNMSRRMPRALITYMANPSGLKAGGVSGGDINTAES
jgi:hypothetical protein